MPTVASPAPDEPAPLGDLSDEDKLTLVEELFQATSDVEPFFESLAGAEGNGHAELSQSLRQWIVEHPEEARTIAHRKKGTPRRSG